MKTNAFKLMAALFVAALSLGFTACGGDDDDDSGNGGGSGEGTSSSAVFPKDIKFETYNVKTPGQLPELISPEKKGLISALKVKGSINGTDLRFIREMAGRDVNGLLVENDAALNYLDLSEAKIVDGGQIYYKKYSEIFETQNNVLGKYTFYNCHLLKAVALPKSIYEIGSEAFSDCYGLTSINIPKSVTSIGYSAFYKCWSLTSINIPKSVTSIGEKAFAYCKGMKDVIVHWHEPIKILSVFYYTPKENLHIPAGTLSAYMNAVEWKNYIEDADDYPVE